MLESWADEYLLERIRFCNKTALILPAYKCSKISRKLGRTGLPINIGVETFTKPNTGLSFEGLVPRYIFRRIQGLQESGMFGWWTKFLSGQAPAKDDVRTIKTSMSGNIVIIFIMLGWGLAGDLSVFVVENIIRIFKLIKSTVTWSWLSTLYLAFII